MLHIRRGTVLAAELLCYNQLESNKSLIFLKVSMGSVMALNIRNSGRKFAAFSMSLILSICIAKVF